MLRGAVVALALLRALAPLGAAAADEATPSIERLDPRLDAIVPSDARVERIADGFVWTEGPVWREATASLLFTDIPRNVVLEWREGEAARVAIERAGHEGDAPFAGREPGANGLALDRDGRLLLCQHGERRIVRLEPDGTRTVLADRFEGRRLNSPNDLTLAKDGALFFTDPPFGLPGAFDDPARELDFAGIYRLAPDGTLSLVTRALRAPNGIALAPDGATLYASNADPADPYWVRFPLRADGRVGPATRFGDAPRFAASGPGVPDGMEVDAHGNLFATGPGGVFVFAPDGALLGRIVTGVATANVALGEGGRTLFVTAGDAVLRVRLATPARGAR